MGLQEIDMFVALSDKPFLTSREMEIIVSSLPSSPMLKVYDVKTALGVDENVVYNWIDEGRFSVLNRGSGASGKKIYSIFRESFLQFIKTRVIPGGGKK
ncbi:MAG: hypothetical protein IKO64_06045 [Kiritimatiellae bacterium]|nr:hypothetical protein [Kiritimatiellia bacterium]